MFGGKLRLVLVGMGATLYSIAALCDVLEDDVLATSAMVSLEELETARGRQNLQVDIDDIQISAQHNQGEQFSQLSDNVLHSEITGGNFIQTDALNGVSGIATIIQNTGNQVIIQDTTMVNIMVKP